MAGEMLILVVDFASLAQSFWRMERERERDGEREREMEREMERKRKRERDTKLF